MGSEPPSKLPSFRGASKGFRVVEFRVSGFGTLIER